MELLYRDSIKKSVYEIISKVTGHAPEDIDKDMFLEADLGLDSIKMITVLNEVMGLVPADRTEEFTAENSVASMMAMQTVGDIVEVFENWYMHEIDEQMQQNEDNSHKFQSSSNEEVTARDRNIEVTGEADKEDIYKVAMVEANKADNHKEAVAEAKSRHAIYEIISKVTGHSLDAIDNDMYLEADLGLDSIKMIAVMNDMINLFPPGQMEKFTAENSVASMMTAQTVGEIAEIFENWQETSTQAHTSEKASMEQPQYDMEGQQEYLEVLNSQYAFLTCYQAISTLTICSGVMVKGELNILCLQAAWEELIYRHPALRIVFEAAPRSKSFKGYKQKVLKHITLPDIKVEDIRYLNSSMQDKYLKESYEEHLNSKFDVFNWPLHNISVLQTGDSRFYIVLTIIHLITDGLGNQQLLRELLKIYSAKLRGTKSGLPPGISVFEYNNLVNELNSWRSPQEAAALKSYLVQQGKEKYFFTPYGKDKKLELPEPFRPIKTKIKKFWIDESSTEKLFSSTKIWKVSLFVLFVSAYLKTIKQLKESESKIIINLPTGGKVYPNADATGVLSSFAQNLALSFDMKSTEESWEDLIKKVNSEIKGKLSSGLDRAQTYQAALATKENEMLIDGKMPETVADIIRSSVKSNLYLSFIGNTNIKAGYGGNLEVEDYEAYTCTNPGTIDILVELFQGRILLTSNYDSSFFEDAYIDIHLNRFISNIYELASLSAAVEQSKQVSGTPAIFSKRVEAELCRIAGEICQRDFTARDLDKDIDSELGMDSLERIRLVTRLSKTSKELDRNGMFVCGTLREMSHLLEESSIAINENREIPDIQIPYMKIVQQCKLTPNATAILFENQSITYGELERITNRLANYLNSQGLGSGSLVGIMTLPGPAMLFGMLGILKAGAAYVPVDPSYPAGRLQYIINHSEIKLLITEASLLGQANSLIEACHCMERVISLDKVTNPKEFKAAALLDTDVWMEYPAVEPEYKSRPEDLMVVLYTSGSTGNPKGVMLKHLGYMNRLVWHQKIFDIKLGERVAQKTSCCFDISVWELFWPLMYGGTVCPVRQEIVKNPWTLAQWMIDSKINIMHFVPSLFGEFVHALEQEAFSFKALRWLIFSGEALPMYYVQEWIDRHGTATQLANLYGPTEASIDVTYHIIEKRPGAEGENQIPIGKPVDNVFILNLDENMRIKKAGEIGELWIGGIQLAKGYLKNPEKSAESFRPNPFSEIPGDFLYRTGDLTREREDGCFEYHGRIDNQVKIRGFRIELGEIETVLNSHSNVNEAAVIAVDGNEGQSLLVAYLSGRNTSDSEIKDHIGNKLPHYMIPHRIEWLESLPKNPNGKLDRRAMQEVYRNKYGAVKTNEPAVINQVQEQPQDVYIKGQEAVIPLAPAQRWLMNFFDYPYNWTGFTRFLFKQPLDYHTFNKAINMLANRHDALRSILCQKDSQWAQKILPQGSYLNVEYFDAAHMDKEQMDQAVDELINHAIQSFEVDKWPLWKVIVVKISDSMYHMAFVGHHLISDVVTNNLLFKEIWQIYYSILCGEEVKLQASRSYREFVEHAEYEKDKKLQDYVAYWKDRFPLKEEVFRIPADFNLGANVEGSAATVAFVLDSHKTSIILSKAKRFFGSKVYPVLLAPLYKLLGEQYKQSKVIISHRVHGREIDTNASFFQTAGNFAVNFPMGIDLIQDEAWGSLVEKVKNSLETIPMNGISYDLVSDYLPVYMYPDTKITPVRANYLGNRDLPKFDNFEFSKAGMDRRYSVPQQKRISVIEFFFSIVDGRLNLEIEYSKNLFKTETIEQLGEKYIESMTKLISFVEEESIQTYSNKPFQNRKNGEGLLADKVVIITGGGRGIGRSIALTMAKEGAEIVIVSRTREQLEQTAQEMQQLGVKAMIIPADISRQADVDKAIELVLREYGKIDVLVNNAGITKFSAINDIEPEEWRKIIDVNLFGTYNFCRAVIPHFIKNNQGKIINMGSDSSFIGYPLMSAYAASKHAVLGLTKSLAEELKPYDIQVNAICPALVDTDMAPKALKNRAIPPEKISDTAVFLASAMSDYITGEAIKVYGKQDMYWFGSQQTAMFKTLLQSKKSSISMG